jgi:hypothetical protein
MKETAYPKSQYIFALAGLSSAVLTLTLGAFWRVVFVLATGLIFAVALLTAEVLIDRHMPPSDRLPLSRRLIAAMIIVVSGPCAVVLFTVVPTISGSHGAHLQRSTEALMDIGGLNVAGLFTACVFYSALRVFAKVKRVVLLQLMFVAIITAIISGSTPVWAHKFLILTPRWSISPLWVTLLILGETGFAWVWGNQR